MSMLAPVLNAAIQKVKGTRYENPVVTKEIRTRMRGAKAHWLMMFYVLLLGIVVLMVYYGLWMTRSGNYDPRTWLSLRVGYKLFSGLTITQAILIAFIAPALTSGSLTIEKEQQTIEMLSLTSLSPRNIVAGKLTSSMLFISMLLGCSLPLAGICLMFGSISPLEIVVTYLLLTGWAFLLCSSGIFFSSLFKKTSGASLVAFGTTVIYSLMSLSLLYGWVASNMFGPRSGYSGQVSGGFIFTGLSPFLASYLCLDTASVFGLKMPVSVVTLAFDVSVSLFLLTVATTKLPFHKVDKTRAIRLWILGITLVTMFLLFGNVFSLTGVHPGNANQETLFMFIVLLVAVTPCIPAFATGPITDSKRLLSQILLGPVHRRFFQRSPVGGLWFLILWFVAGCGVIGISAAIAGHATGFPGGGPRVARLAMDWPMFYQTALALLASVIGISSIGILCSTVISGRQSAAAVVVLLVILTWVVFPIMQMQHDSAIGYGWQNTHGVQWQLAYLWPYTPLLLLAGEWRQGGNAPQLWLSSEFASLGCMLAWALVSAGALMLASRLAGRGGIQDE